MSFRFRFLLLIVLMAGVLACGSAFAQTAPPQLEAPTAAAAPAPDEPSSPPPPPAIQVDHSEGNRESSPLHVAAENAKLPLAIVNHDDYKDWVSAQLFMIIAGLIVTLIVLV